MCMYVGVYVGRIQDTKKKSKKRGGGEGFKKAGWEGNRIT